MSVASVVNAGRRAAQRDMTLTLAVYQPNGTTTNGDGYQVPAFTTKTPTVGKVQSVSADGADTNTRFIRIGGADKPILEAGLHIPIGAQVPAPGHPGVGWEYVVTAVGVADDPALLNRRYLVVETPAKSFATARRLNVVQL